MQKAAIHMHCREYCLRVWHHIGCVYQFQENRFAEVNTVENVAGYHVGTTRRSIVYCMNAMHICHGQHVHNHNAHTFLHVVLLHGAVPSFAELCRMDVVH